MILVTGADGIVGRAICRALIAASKTFLPVVHRRRITTHENAYVTDLSRPDSLDGLKSDDIDAIVHLAAAVPHSSNYPDNERSADVTRRMDRNVRSFQKLLNIPAIYMSTCGLYDRSLPMIKHEDDASKIKFETPYFAAKLEGEKLFGNGPQTIIMRLSAPIGPGQKAGVVVSRFIAVARKSNPIQIWGTGSREQNFIDVRDVADLIMKSLASPRQCIINVASESPTTMIDLAKTIVNVLGKGSIEFSQTPDPRDGETARYSVERAMAYYDWSPKYLLADSCRLIQNECFEN